MKRRVAVSLLGGAALAPLARLSVYADTPDVCGIPAASNDGWPVASLADDKFLDPAALCRMADGLAANHANIHSVLIAHAGKLVFERYFSGYDEIYDRKIKNATFDPTTRHSLKSVSKSVASLVVGIAIDRGLIPSVDAPIMSFFPELADMHTPERDRLKLVHALTMSMGLKWIEATPTTGDDNNDEERMHWARDPARYVMGLPIVAPPGQEFFYSTGALTLVSAIVRKSTGKPLDEFARTELLAPLGITDFEWNRYKGDTDAGGGLRMRPRDMAKIGQLVLNGGQWNGRQIVSKNWIETSTARHLEATNGMSYGYLWWQGRSPNNGREDHWVGALGRGGQYIRIVPALDLVVVVTAGYYQDDSPQAFKLQYSVFKDTLQSVSTSS